MRHFLLTTHKTADCVDDVLSAMRCHGSADVVVYNVDDLCKLDCSMIDVIISDRTSFIFPRAFINSVRAKIINSHPSLLPNHRGSHPLFFSTLMGDSFGISLHYVDEGIDTGAVVYRKEIDYHDDMTFRQLYGISRMEVLHGISTVLRDYSISGRIDPITPYKKFRDTQNFMKNFYPIFELLPNGWDTPIGEARRTVSHLPYFRR